MNSSPATGSKFNFEQKSQNVKIRLSSFTTSMLDSAVAHLVSSLKKVGAMVIGPVPLPNSASVFSVNKSPHIDGKSKERFRIVRHYRMLILLNATTTEVDAISSINIPSGVGVEIQVTARKN